MIGLNSIWKEVAYYKYNEVNIGFDNKIINFII